MISLESKPIVGNIIRLLSKDNFSCALNPCCMVIMLMFNLCGLLSQKTPDCEVTIELAKQIINFNKIDKQTGHDRFRFRFGFR